MAWFSRLRSTSTAEAKLALTPDLVADGVAERILRSPHSPPFLEAMTKFGHQVDENCRWEWVVINMLATFRGVLASALPDSFKRSLLADAIPKAIRKRLTSPEQQDWLDRLVATRFDQYEPLLAVTQQRPFALGLSFCQNLGCSTDAGVAIFARIVFHETMKVELEAANRYAALL